MPASLTDAQKREVRKIPESNKLEFVLLFLCADIIFRRGNATLARLTANGEFEASLFRGDGAALDMTTNAVTLRTQQNITALAEELDIVSTALSRALQNATNLANRVSDLEVQILAFQSKPIPLSRRALYTSSGTWAAPANLSVVIVEAYGGGGGGTSGSCFNSGYTCFTGGGGGGGGFVSKTFFNFPAGATISMTIGAGGGPSTAGGETSAVASVGGATLAAGPGGGACCSTTGGIGGSASGGDVNISGSWGSQSGSRGLAAGQLGSVFGQGGAGAFSSNAAEGGSAGAVYIMY